ncbi:S41 family peptidase, partial [Parapedobacter defluvii]|uniref:S41 family peptidase n=1 Tax=Parapedobacter defluvii TaxID=2045106 RepID=UPI00333EA59C
PALSKQQMEDLKTLGLIWGFVKYYHPAIASGEVNWDYELFRVLPSVLQAPDQGARDAVLVKWINKLGPVKKGDAAPTKAKVEPDLDWISTTGLSHALTTLLQEIRSAKRTNEHFYIGMTPGVGNPVFKNESAYYAMEAADDGMRLLALYRYWNMIQYFFPYKNLIEEDWKDVLGEFIPKFTEVDNTEGYVLALLELIGRIHDTHANIGGNSVLDKFFGERYAPVNVYFVEEQAVVTGYAHAEWGKATGLEVGDVVAAINGKTVADRIKELLKYTPASNYPTQLRDIGPKLLRSNDSTIRVEVLRSGNRLSRVLKTYKPSELTLNNLFKTRDTSFRMIGDSIAYVNNGSLNPKDLLGYWDRLKQSKGLIIDDRNYPSHFPIYEFSKYLMPRPAPFVVSSVGSVLHPGYFVLNKQISVGAFNDKRYDGNVVILVNEVSQSSAEFHAMAYRVHPNAVVIGSTTAGADGNVSAIMLPGGIRTAISGVGVYYPDGGETQRVGIVPDIEVKPTIEGIKAGRDEVLEKAIELIEGTGISEPIPVAQIFSYMDVK